MTWFKVDDGFSDHPKVRSMPRSVRAAAVGLWTLAGSWCAHHLTDGHVPAYMLPEWGCTKRHAEALVQAGLWRRSGDGYAFHEWDGHQPSREQVKDRRAKTAERVARWRATHAQDVPPEESVSNGVTNGVTNGVSNAAPDPTRPDPKEYVDTSPWEGGAGGDTSQAPPAPPKRTDRGTRITEDWVPTAKTRDDLRAQYTRPDEWWRREHERFVNHFLAKSGKDARKVRWDQAFRNWIHEAVDREGQRRPVAVTVGASTTDERVAQAQALKRGSATDPSMPRSA